MEEEIFNPRRPYRFFHPRQAMRGRATTGTPTNRATVGLYNNSTGRSTLAVRDVTISGTASDTVAIQYVQTQVATTAGQQAALVANEAITPGLMAWIDTATAYSGDYIAALTAQGAFWWQHDYPFAVVQPGYSLIFQDTTVAHALTVSLIWEAIEIDQLDWFF
jgi:hypothetical protein